MCDSLNDLTIVIPFKLDVKERIRNLKFLVTYLRNNFENVKIIIGEVDKKPKLKKYFGCDYIFLRTESDLFQKTKVLNLLINESHTKFVCSHDVDILLNPLDIVKAYRLLSENKINFAFPYNRIIYCIRGKYNRMVFRMIRDKQPVCFPKIDLRFHTFGAPGGAFIFNKNEFIRCGMENENFEGWGFEDDERYYRLIKLNHIVYCMDNPAYHLHHQRKKYQRIDSDQGIKNKKILFDTILSKNKNELVKEITRWNWVSSTPYTPIIKTTRNRAKIRVAFYSIYSGPQVTLDVVNRYTPNNDYKFDKLRLVKSTEDYDFIVTNFGFPDFDPDIAKTKGIIIQSEPRWFRKALFPSNLVDPVEGKDCYKLFSISKYHSLDFHWAEFTSTYTEIKDRYLDLDKIHRIKFVSVISNKFVEGIEGLNYLKRVKFLQYLDKLDNWSFYGRLFKEFDQYDTTKILMQLSNFRGPCQNKESILMDSLYNFDAENCCEENYFTEKAFGGILCTSLTFYDGCPNLEKFIDPRCFIRINLNNMDESLEIVKRSIFDNEFGKRLGFISTYKQILIRKFNPLRILQDFIEDKYEL